MGHTEKSLQHEYEKVSVQENVPDIENIPHKYGFGVRHIQLAIILLCLMVNFMARGHMGVTIVAMTDVPKNKTTIHTITLNLTIRNDTGDLLNNFTKQELESNISRNEFIENVILWNITEKSHNIYNDYLNISRPWVVHFPPILFILLYYTFKWPKSVQEMVLNSFFLGYSIMMFPMGLVCQRYGGKLPLQIALFINGVVSMVTPWVTTWGGWKAVCVCRILQGLSQAGTYPCTQNLIAKWASVDELATLTSYVYTGTLVGTVVAFQMAGLLGESRWGWPSTFYTFGMISFLCFMLLTLFGAASPMDHKTITDEEKKYIIGPAKNGNTRIVQGKLKTPWRAMVTSVPLWGVLIAQIGSNMCFIFFLNQVPSYIHSTLGINVKNSGLLSSLPYLASFFSSIGFGWISDYLTNNNIISLNNARRIFNTIAQVGLAISLIYSSYTTNITVAVTCLVIAMATHVAVHSGWMVNHIDLSPNFSGSIMATNATISMTIALLNPIIVSYVVTDTTNVVQWRIIFFIISSFAVLSDIIFIFLISTDIQPWNYADFNETCGDKIKEEIKELNNQSDTNQINHSGIAYNTELSS